MLFQKFPLFQTHFYRVFIIDSIEYCQFMGRNHLDLWRLDPNWQFASQHGEASKPGIVSYSVDRKNSIVMCPCCLNVIQKEQVSLFENPKQLHFLGYGFPLFYNMLMTCMISLVILILSSSALLLYLSLSEDCEERLSSTIGKDHTYPCRGVFVKMARINPNPEYLEMDRIIRCLSFLGQAAVLIYMRDVQRKLSAYYNERQTRIKDFSIIFKNLPKITNIQAKLKEFLQSFSVPPKVEEIFLIPKIDYFYGLEKEKKQIIEHLKKQMKQQSPSQIIKASLLVQLGRIDDEMIEACKKFKDLYEKDQLFSEKAIVILQTKQQKRAILEEFKMITKQEKEKYFYWMTDHVTLESAPQPRQIIWSNINYPRYKRWLRTILGWGLGTLFLAAVTGIFYFWVNYKAVSHSMGMMFGAVILIQFFNKFIMKVFLHWFGELQMPETSSEREFSYAFKYTIGMFFTTAIMAIIVEALIYNNLQFQYGVIESETIMFFFNAFVVNILWILHPQYYFHKFIRWLKFGKKNITQKEANQLMEDCAYDMGKRYAEVIETMWFTFLYASLIPFGTFLTLMGLMIYYWVDKYNLLRRSKIQNLIESRLPLNAIKLMELTLFWKPLGELIFDIKIRDVIFVETYVMLGLSVVFLLMPWNWFLDKFFHERFNLSKQTYQEVKYQFNETYQTVDPMQRMLGLSKFIEIQNKARLKKLQRASKRYIPSFLQVRDYSSQNRPMFQDFSVSRINQEEL